jgi:hypothetical protein
MSIQLIIVYDCFLTVMAELSSCESSPMAHKP